MVHIPHLSNLCGFGEIYLILWAQFVKTGVDYGVEEE
jgi:hypothetical protein